MMTDFDDAYTNAAYIPGSADYPARWQENARAFRADLPKGCTSQLDIPYGTRPRNTIDLFLPGGAPRGLSVFVHGGYWMRFGKDDWSHLARGALLRGWAVALPGYTLTPDVRISDITREISTAIELIAAHVAGPVRLAGHSAGGHLVTRMMCSDSALPGSVLERVQHVVSISGVHDLRPLLHTKMNETLRLDLAEARAESPALLEPVPGIGVTCWVGKDERPEFVRQNDLLVNAWTGLGVEIAARHHDNAHHFNVIDGLSDPESELAAVFAAP
jgi:arylformamidase